MKRFTQNAESVLKEAIKDEDELLSLCSYAYGNVQRRYFNNKQGHSNSSNPSALHSAAKKILSPGTVARSKDWSKSSKNPNFKSISEEEENFHRQVKN